MSIPAVSTRIKPVKKFKNAFRIGKNPPYRSEKEIGDDCRTKQKKNNIRNLIFISRMNFSLADPILISVLFAFFFRPNHFCPFHSGNSARFIVAIFSVCLFRLFSGYDFLTNPFQTHSVSIYITRSISTTSSAEFASVFVLHSPSFPASRISNAETILFRYPHLIYRSLFSTIQKEFPGNSR